MNREKRRPVQAFERIIAQLMAIRDDDARIEEFLRENGVVLAK